MISIYEMIAALGRDSVRAWLEGRHVDGLEDLDEEDRAAISSAWPFWARPGQRWVPGPETITYYSAGRGFGKSLILSNILGEAAMDPDRWGGEALLVGITPGDARSLLEQDTGIFAVAREYGYPYPEAKWSMAGGEVFYPHPRGGGRGLHLRVASSNKPASARGPNVGLLVADEWAFFANDRDEQGYTTWEAAMNALRIGEAKAVIVSSPSSKMAVREMRDLAEKPACKDRRLPGGTVQRGCGAVLPATPPTKISPLFSATTTSPVRTCPSCGATVVADVRLIRASSLDNAAHLKPSFQDRAELALKGGTRQARGEFGGEILDSDSSAPIPSIEVHHLDGLQGGRDPWMSLRSTLQISRVVIAVDPATTAGEGSADTGVIVAGLAKDSSRRAVLGLQDWSVCAAEVTGSPSKVWAPRVAVLAAMWRAESVAIEVNQGGLEVLDPAIQALRTLREEDVRAAIESEGVACDSLLLSQAMAAARRCEVKQITRRADKATRWEWASTYAAAEVARTGGDGLALVRAPWLPADHWQATAGHLTRYRPGERARRAEPIDRGDTLISAAQVLLGVRERAGAHGLVDPASSPVYSGAGIFG